MTITEFLTARLDEAESGWRAHRRAEVDGCIKPVFHFGRPLAEEMLADIAAKRAIIHQHGNNDGGHECPDGFMDGAETEPHTGYEVVCMTQRHLASVYSGHPDYNPEWSTSDTPSRQSS